MGHQDANGLLARPLLFIGKQRANCSQYKILACVKGLSSAGVSCGGAKSADDLFLRLDMRVIASRF
ncbi:hypothetical protein VSR69_41135 [Paraburkholderia phytofirmans]